MFPEASTVGFDQHVAVLKFFRSHVVEQFCGGRVGLTQPFSKIGEDPAIFFFQ